LHVRRQAPAKLDVLERRRPPNVVRLVQGRSSPTHLRGSTRPPRSRSLSADGRLHLTSTCLPWTSRHAIFSEALIAQPIVLVLDCSMLRILFSMKRLRIRGRLGPRRSTASSASLPSLADALARSSGLARSFAPGHRRTPAHGREPETARRTAAARAKLAETSVLEAGLPLVGTLAGDVPGPGVAGALFVHGMHVRIQV